MTDVRTRSAPEQDSGAPPNPQGDLGWSTFFMLVKGERS